MRTPSAFSISAMFEPPLPITLATCLLATVTFAFPSDTTSTRARGSNRLNASAMRLSARRATPLLDAPPCPFPAVPAAADTGTITFSSPNV